MKERRISHIGRGFLSISRKSGRKIRETNHGHYGRLVASRPSGWVVVDQGNFQVGDQNFGTPMTKLFAGRSPSTHLPQESAIGTDADSVGTPQWFAPDRKIVR